MTTSSSLRLALPPILFLIVACSIQDSLRSTPSRQSLPESQSGRSKTDNVGKSNNNPFIVSAKELVDEYEANHLRFEEKYDNKWVRVTGVVSNIESDRVDREFDRYALQGIRGLNLGPPQASLSDPAMVATVGQSFTATCLVQGTRGRTWQFFTLRGCYIPTGGD